MILADTMILLAPLTFSRRLGSHAGALAAPRNWDLLIPPLATSKKDGPPMAHQGFGLLSLLVSSVTRLGPRGVTGLPTFLLHPL
jgi:hypothetical protein